ncbi:hypothetical protein CP157_01159 [Paracoccus marcusii]|nr:hypothetical protein CP157_01159 [Paracoccus marcusii]
MALPKYFATVGQHFGHLTVTGEARTKNAVRWVECTCDCGKTVDVIVSQLFTGRRTSCGCARVSRSIEMGSRNIRHGASRNGKRTPTYLSWASMRLRCMNPNATGYARYGGAGIGICPEWSGEDGFSAFLADMGERPEGKTLDRRDNAKGYSPENCRWADMATQKRNRSVARLITYSGETKTAAEWARVVGTHRNNILRRLKRGLPLDQVLRP